MGTYHLNPQAGQHPQGKSQIGTAMFLRQTEGLLADRFSFCLTWISNELRNGSQHRMGSFSSCSQNCIPSRTVAWCESWCWHNCHRKQVIHQKIAARLKKPSYGMNDVLRRWWNTLDEALLNYGMIPTRAGWCCYVLYSLQSRKQAREHWGQWAFAQQNGTKDVFTESRERSETEAAFVKKTLDPIAGSQLKESVRGVGDVVGVKAPLGGVAQVIFHGVQVCRGLCAGQGTSGQRRGRRRGRTGWSRKRGRRDQREQHMCDMRMTWDERLNELEPRGSWHIIRKTGRTTNGVLLCSLVQFARIVIVRVIVDGVLGVMIVVLTGHDEVLVNVVQFT